MNWFCSPLYFLLLSLVVGLQFQLLNFHRVRLATHSVQLVVASTQLQDCLVHQSVLHVEHKVLQNNSDGI